MCTLHDVRTHQEVSDSDCVVQNSPGSIAQSEYHFVEHRASCCCPIDTKSYLLLPYVDT